MVDLAAEMLHTISALLDEYLDELGPYAISSAAYVAPWLAAESRQRALPFDWFQDSLSFEDWMAETTGAGERPAPISEFRPRRNHTQTTQKPRLSGTFGGRHLWIRKAGTEKARRTT